MKKIFTLNKFFFSVLFFLSTVTVQLICSQQTFASAHLIWHPAGVNTNWSNANNWRIRTYGGTTASNAPIAADTAEIGPNNSNFTVVLDVDTAVTVLIVSGTGQIFLNTSTSKTLRVTGDAKFSNTNSVGGGTCTIKLIGSANSSLTGNTTSTNKGKLPNLIIAKTSGTTLTINNYVTLGGSTKLKYVSGTIDPTTSTVGFYLTNTIVGNFTLNNAEFMGNSSTVTDSNTLTLNGNLLITGSAYCIINTGTIELYGNLDNQNTSGSSGGTASIVMKGTATQTYSYSSGPLCNFKVNKSSGTVSAATGTTALSVTTFELIAGTFTAPTGTFNVGANVQFTANTTIFNHSGGTFSHNNGTVLFETRGNLSYTFTVDVLTSTQFYDVTVSQKPYSGSPVETLTGGSGDTIKVAHNLTHTDGTIAGIIEVKRNLIVGSAADAGLGKIILDGSDTTKYSYTTGGVTCILEVNKSSTVVLANSGTTNLNCTGLRIIAGTFIAPTGTLNIGGNTQYVSNTTLFNHVGGTFTNNNGTVLFETRGNVNYTFTVDVLSATQFYDLNISLKPYSGAPIETFNGGSGDTMKVLHNFTLTDGTVSSTPLNVQGSVTVASTFDGGTSALIFSGGNSQNFDLTGATGLYNGSIYIKKSANSVTLQSACTLDASSQTLNFVTGNIISTSTNLLTIGDNVTVSGASDNSFVSGPVKKVGNDPFKFCIGKGSSYKPDSISAPSSTTDAFTSEYFSSAHGTTTTDTSLTYLSKCEYWNIDRTTGTSNVKVKLYWNTSTCDIYTLSTLKIARLESGTWKSIGAVTTSGSTTTGNIISNSTQGTFGYYTIGKKSPVVYANAGTDAAICYSASATLGGSPTSTGGLTAYTYTWSPSTGLSNLTVANPTASPTATTTYTVTVTDLDHSTATDAVVVTVNPKIDIYAGGDKVLCPGGDAFLGSAPTASGGTGTLTYSWSPSTGLDTATIANPHCTTTVTTSYILTVTDANSCVVRDTVNDTISTAVVAHAGNDTTVTVYAHVKLGATVTATGGSGNYGFDWSPTAYIDSLSVTHPIAKLPRTQTFKLYVEDENGCNDEDEVTVTVSNPLPVNDADLGGIPFIENVGQVIDISGGSITDIKFKSALSNSDLYVWDTALTIIYAHFDSAATSPDSLSLMNILFDNANTGSLAASAGDSLDIRGNYFLSYLPDYYTNVRTSRFISYKNIYTGIDADLFNSGGGMSWHFVVDTIGNYTDISFNFQGADSLNFDTLGNVYVYTPLAIFSWAAPFATQTISGRTDTLTASYSVSGNHLSLNIASHNVHHPIDIFYNHPTNPSVGPPLDGIYMDWSTYFGGAEEEQFNAIDASENYSSGQIVACGNSSSYTLPTDLLSSATFYQSTLTGQLDIIITKFTISDRALTNFTYYGGSSDDYAWDIKKAHSGNLRKIYFCGNTGSTNFPIQQPFTNSYFRTDVQTTFANGDGFVVSLDNDCSSLIWATYLKGNGASAMAIDHSGGPIHSKLLIVGSAYCNGDNGLGSNCGGNATTLEFDPLSLAGAYNHATNDGLADGTIMQFNINPHLTNTHYGQLEWATYLGGSDQDYFKSIDVSDFGAIVIGGKTKSTDIDITASAPQPSHAPFSGYFGFDAYYAYFTALRHLGWATYLGGSYDEGYSWNDESTPGESNVKFFPKGTNLPNFIADGNTLSSDFPINGTYATSFQGGLDQYIIYYKIPNVVSSSCFGGSSYEGPVSGISLPTYPPDIFYLVGGTLDLNNDFPIQNLTLASYFDGSYNGGGDAYISRFILEPISGNFINQWTTFIGGAEGDYLRDVDVNDSHIFTVGFTGSYYGHVINNVSGQQYLDRFPLCNFHSGIVDFYQQHYSSGYSNAGGSNNISGGYDAVIMSFNDPCGTACYRGESIDETFKEDSIINLSFLVYPNPTDNSTVVYCKEGFKNPILVYNNIGELIFRINNTTNQYEKIDLSGYAAGMYLIKSGDNSAKIIKQ